MIRQANNNDISEINNLGSLIDSNYSKLYDIFELLNKDYTKFYVYEEDNKILGFIHLEELYEISNLVNIAVSANYQHNGIGTKLLEYAIQNTKADKIMLEVRESNINAINLYNKLNFNTINIRKKYYGNEDALIMERVII